MKKVNNLGFSIIELVLVLLVLAALVGAGVFAYSNFKKNQDNTNKSSTSAASDAQGGEADITLQNLGLASFDSISYNRFAVSEYTTNGLKGFYNFGETLSGGRLNPTLEYASLKPGTKAVSAIDGVVVNIKEQLETKDTEVFIQPKNGSMWTVGYDHIKNVVVKQGASIKAGDPIGEPAVQNNGIPRFEIQINKDKDGTTTHHCPSSLLHARVAAKWIADLTTMQNTWESTTGLELYDLSKQDPVGCVKKTLSVAEAEGR